MPEHLGCDMEETKDVDSSEVNASPSVVPFSAKLDIANTVVSCRHCKQQLNEGANVCYHCSRDQRPFYKQFTPATTMLMVVVAFSQVVIAGFQTYESHTKKVEAEDVLKNARHTFMIASSNSSEMKMQAAKVLKNANDTDKFTKDMAKKAESDITETKKSFQDLAVALTDATVTSLALQGEIIYGMTPQAKEKQIDTIVDKLRKLGVSESGVDTAVESFTTLQRYKLFDRVLYLINEQLPANKKVANIGQTKDIDRSMNYIDVLLKTNNIHPTGELNHAILDLKYYDKYKRLRK